MMNEIDWNDFALRKTSIKLGEHATSFTLEPPFLIILKHIAQKERIALRILISQIDSTRPLESNLSSALRLYCLQYALENGITHLKSVD